MAPPTGPNSPMGPMGPMRSPGSWGPPSPNAPRVPTAHVAPGPAAAASVPPTTAPAARRGGLRLPPTWPVYALFIGFPLWWVLGLGSFIWPIVAVPMLLALLRRGDVRMPRGFGWWLLFMGWIVVSGTQLGDAGRVGAYLYRGSTYFSATVLFLYLYNMPSEAVPARKIVVALCLFWMFVVFGGYLGTLLPNGSFSTPLQKIVPAGLGDSSLQNWLHPTFANRGEASHILGYSVGRPSAPFAYTNMWGSNFALLVPFVVMSWALVKKRSWKLLTIGALGASIVPVVSSLNRGLWLSLGLGLVYAAILSALKGRVKPFLAVMSILVVTVGLALLPPIHKIISDRLAHGHSDVGREELYSEAISRVKEKPILGFGAPIESQIDPTKPSVGTHGQFWLLLVSTGIPGTIFYLGWFGLALWRSRKGSAEIGQWCHVILLIALIQIFFYELLPAQLHLAMIAAALSLREFKAPTASQTPVAGGTAVGARRGVVGAR
jgi:hypothetical protein